MTENLRQLSRMPQASKEKVAAAARLDICWLDVISEKLPFLKKKRQAAHQ
jgi:hypothetical protein